MTSTRPKLWLGGIAALALACQPTTPSTTPTPVPGAAPAAPAAAPAPARPANGAPAPQAPQGGANAAGQPPAGGAPGAQPADPQPRPYNQVIRGEVKTKAGLFKTHVIGSQLYYEIPAAEMGKDLLLVTQIAKTNEGDGYGGQALDERVVRWERRGHRVLLRSVSYAIVSDNSAPIAEAVANANYDAILASFNVAAYGPDSAPVIGVSRTYTNPPSEISVVQRYRGSVDAGRSFLERVATYPKNIEVEATLTIAAQPTPQSFLPGLPPSPPAPGTPPVTKSFVVHWSMVKLPDQPMMPRLRDSRVGYFFTSTTDFSRPEQRAQQRNFIARWRLEKKDPNAALSEPKQPIVY